MLGKQIARVSENVYYIVKQYIFLLLLLPKSGNRIISLRLPIPSALKKRPSIDGTHVKKIDNNERGSKLKTHVHKSKLHKIFQLVLNGAGTIFVLMSSSVNARKEI